ncbi:alpha-1,6-glucosidase domain-containing protein [Undibacterium sp. JH2W]|uniref:alpha-1,6-glucosidase domain-containing protein n=1 Tax=Undibacterium sp. JH2W TaxID=3413037 RepID=UPI003BF1433D
MTASKTIPARNKTGSATILALWLLSCASLAHADLTGANADPDALAACNSQQFETTLAPSSTPETDARAYWLSSRLLRWPGLITTNKLKLYASRTASLHLSKGSKASGFDEVLSLKEASQPLDTDIIQRFSFTGPGQEYELSAADSSKTKSLLQAQVLLAVVDADDKIIDYTSLQIAGALDDLYKPASNFDNFGVSINNAIPDKNMGHTQFSVWAPTAQRLSVCVYPNGKKRASALLSMQLDSNTGIWQATSKADLSGKYYTYLAEVHVPAQGLVRNRVTDPYSISLTTDSRRSYIAHLNSSTLKPPGWDRQTINTKVKNQTDMQVYELHVRDFSINDHTVKPGLRGKYLAFTETQSNGMRHLQALSAAGMTDIHLLPVFDFATVSESNCQTPRIKGKADGTEQQKLAMQYADKDCYNWGYEPFHYNAPEGSYATDASDGAKRVLEFRKMLMALHAVGLRVGMDVVYNHTADAGQTAYSVLDRIVPGYYQRLNQIGQIERSTCCDNTATENLMMAKLMSDSILSWTRHYKIDSFRFDLMGHQPRKIMEDMQARLLKETGRKIQFIGEGWNFGEVANSKRFVQASQLSLNGSGIGSFSDRARDALRGGGHGDAGEGIVKNQGYLNGLANQAGSRQALLLAADMLRVGLAGSLREFRMQRFDDQNKQLQEIDYAGQAAGYVSQPGEVVNYVENHDNHTLYDINAFRLPAETSSADRARIQVLALATTAFSQGVAYYHAGVDILRSKSMDGNSFNSGDWFNRLDWSYKDNYFGTGLPPEKDNAQFYPYIKPLLSNPHIKASKKDIAFSRDQFRDLLKIRSSSSLFRLPTLTDIEQRLHFYNTGSMQNPLLIVARLNGKGLAGAHFNSLFYFINISQQSQSLDLHEQEKARYVLHPVHRATGAADRRIATEAKYDEASGRFSIPALSAVVFVEDE